jgi:hypothetical protein
MCAAYRTGWLTSCGRRRAAPFNAALPRRLSEVDSRDHFFFFVAAFFFTAFLAAAGFSAIGFFFGFRAEMFSLRVVSSPLKMRSQPEENFLLEPVFKIVIVVTRR